MKLAPRPFAQKPTNSGNPHTTELNSRIENSLKRIDDKFTKLNTNLQKYQDIMGPAKEELQIAKLNIQALNKRRLEATSPGGDLPLMPERQKSIE